VYMIRNWNAYDLDPKFCYAEIFINIIRIVQEKSWNTCQLTMYDIIIDDILVSDIRTLHLLNYSII